MTEPSSAPSDAPNRAMITVTAMMATVMQTLDSTIANVALPHMAGALSATTDQITWVLTSYIVAAAIATPLTGWLTARLGRKRVFLVAVAGFTVASVLCGVSENLNEIVMARLLQGMFGASLIPLSQSVLLDINPPERHARAMALWGMGVMIGPVLGPTLGGFLTENWNWRWVFFINLPVGIFSFVGLWRFLPDAGKRTMRFDAIGFTLLGVAIGALQILLDRGDQKDWFGSMEIRIEALTAGIAFLFFVLHTATDGEGSFLNVNLLKDRNYSTGLAFYFLLGLLLYATRALLPPMLQNDMNYSVMAAGLVTAPSGLGTMLSMMLAGRLSGRIDNRQLIAAGLLFNALSLWAMQAFTPYVTPWQIIWPGFIQGMGVGFMSVPLTTMTFSTLGPQLRSDGTAIYSLSRNIGSSIGISVMEMLFTHETRTIHGSLTSWITPDALVRHAQDPLVKLLNLHTLPGLAALEAVVQQQSEFIAYLDDFRCMMWMSLIALPFLILMRVKPRSP